MKKICFNHVFLTDVLKAWNKIKNNIANNNVKKEIIWNNTKIKCNGETFFTTGGMLEE